MSFRPHEQPIAIQGRDRSPWACWRFIVLPVVSLIAVALCAGPALAAPDAKLVVGGEQPLDLGSMLAFWTFGGLTLIGALLTITRRNPVLAVLFLVLTLFSTGGLFLVLHATFLAAIQVLVYAGAIMVLFIFVVMSVAQYDDEELWSHRGLASKVAGIVAVGLLLARVIAVVTGPEVGKPAATVGKTFGDVRGVGRFLFSDYLFPFEAISILLLVAIVAAVMVSRKVHHRETGAADAPDGGA